MIKIKATGTKATLEETERLTTGRVGLPLAFEFTSEWDSLQKTIVCEGGGVKRDVAIIAGAALTVPHECLATPNTRLHIGVYGALANGTIVIPTIYVDAGIIYAGADPSGVPGSTPTPSETAQIMAAANAAQATAQSVRDDADAGLFDGEDGDPGPQGPAGPQGPKGDKGDDPTVDPTYNPLSANAQSGVGVAEAIAPVNTEVTNIKSKIPDQASSENKLADKNFVNSSIATNTANYISNNGQPFNSSGEINAYVHAHSNEITNNDYAFVRGTDSAGNAYYDRYKFTVQGEGAARTVTFAVEYRLNNSSFTADQWSAISSGITANKVAEIDNKLSKQEEQGGTSTRVYSYRGTTQGQTTVASGVFANTIAFRGTKGTLNVGTPTANNHAATKLYVDARQIKINDIVGSGAQPSPPSYSGGYEGQMVISKTIEQDGTLYKWAQYVWLIDGPGFAYGVWVKINEGVHRT